MTGWTRGGGFHRLVDRWLYRVYQHVSLMYPLADTEAAVREVFGQALADGYPPEDPGERAWIFGLARAAVYVELGDDDLVRRRNAEAVAFGLHDVVDALSGQNRIDARRTLQALTLLAPEEQEILRLQVVEALEPDELGWVLGLGPDRAVELVAAAASRLDSAVDALPSESAGGESGA